MTQATNNLTLKESNVPLPSIRNSFPMGTFSDKHREDDSDSSANNEMSSESDISPENL